MDCCACRFSALAVTGAGTAYAQGVNPMKALQESRRESMALDKRLGRAAAIQRDKEKAAEAVRVKADPQLAAERGPNSDASSAKPALGSLPVLPTGPEVAPDQVVLAAPTVPAPAQLSARRVSPEAPSAGDGVVMEVSMSSQTMRVFVDGKLRYSWRVSTERPEYETPQGAFSPMRLAR